MSPASDASHPAGGVPGGRGGAPPGPAVLTPPCVPSVRRVPPSWWGTWWTRWCPAWTSCTDAALCPPASDASHPAGGVPGGRGGAPPGPAVLTPPCVPSVRRVPPSWWGTWWTRWCPAWTSCTDAALCPQRQTRPTQLVGYLVDAVVPRLDQLY